MDAPSFLTAQFIASVVVILIVVHMLLGAAGMSIYFERKISAYIQDRIGPNRVGFDFGQPWLSFLKGMWGLGQFLADGLKMLLKEEYSPKGADRALFNLAPMVVVIPALIGFAVIPWGGVLSLPETITLPLIGWTIPGGDVLIAGANVNVGIIYILAVASLGVYGIVLAGWASNNKYAFLGSLRASAQMISYEIPLGLSLLTALLMVGSLMPEEMIRHQSSEAWLILSQPLAAIIVFICFLAEANRTPFDNAECEQELVAGFHTEYSSMRFGLFPLSEYAHVAAGSAIFTLLFLGGYHLPLGLIGAGEGHLLSPENTSIPAMLAKFHVFIFKTLAIIFLVILVRWTIPRLRFDQVMQSAWNTVIPLAIVIVVVTAVMIHLGYRSTGAMLLANAGITVFALGLLPILPRRGGANNRKVRLAGSRFSPLEGETVRTSPVSAFAREDRPVESTLPVHSG
ncbi:MAG: NADH-quinone oxidoreductase subunit NuoH [Phycisphaeraceae bacterium]|nr:NADH-quinone oxidoreductase subunit NuoH [Phycisphaeraceae bacterium]